MSKTTNSVPSGTTNADVAKIMVGTLVSTSVRVFAPVLGLFAIGAALDFGLDLKPYGMIIGTSVGIVVAAVLVALQMHSIRKGGKR